MCLGIPGQVVTVSSDRPGHARVDVEGVVRDVDLSFLEDDPAEPGEWVLIHLGFALQKMTAVEVDESRATLAILSGGEADDPFAAFQAIDAMPSPEGVRR